MKKSLIFKILRVVFSLLTFIGAGYVLINHGTVSAGYRVVPMMFALAFLNMARR